MYIHSQNYQQIRNKKKFAESEKGSLKMNLYLMPLLMTKKFIYPYDKIKIACLTTSTHYFSGNRNCTIRQPSTSSTMSSPSSFKKAKIIIIVTNKVLMIGKREVKLPLYILYDTQLTTWKTLRNLFCKILEGFIFRCI